MLDSFLSVRGFEPPWLHVGACFLFGSTPVKGKRSAGQLHGVQGLETLTRRMFKVELFAGSFRTLLTATVSFAHGSKTNFVLVGGDNTFARRRIHQPRLSTDKRTASHPTLPYQAQSAAIAIEDGLVLGLLLSRLKPSDRILERDKHAHIPRIPHLFESLRNKRTAINIKGAIRQSQKG